MAAVATTTPAAFVEGATDHGPANKRLRDEQDSSDPSDENTEDMDQASFTVVSYKKKRGTGVPVVFRPTMEGGSFWKVNPNIVASAVVTSAQEKVLNHRLNKDGSLMVTVSTLPAANRLLTVTELAGVAVEARVPYSYTANYGKIQDVLLSYSNEDLRDYLRETSCQQGGSPSSHPKMEARSKRYAVDPLFWNSPRTHHYLNELRLGSAATRSPSTSGQLRSVISARGTDTYSRHCNGPVRCKVCAGPHSHKECTSRAQPKCANCGGSTPCFIWRVR
ncbi:hypothetical protein MTO96_035449 [Rhipicephalus appendiculatus]